MSRINFFQEETDFKLQSPQKIRRWLNSVALAEHKSIDELNFIFCSDPYLLKINHEYLNHDTYTDVITFDHSENSKELAGDIFISIDRITENAINFETSFQKELNRVIAHGVLHLIGYQDKTEKDQLVIRSKEELYINNYKCSTWNI